MNGSDLASYIAERFFRSTIVAFLAFICVGFAIYRWGSSDGYERGYDAAAKKLQDGVPNVLGNMPYTQGSLDAERRIHGELKAEVEEMSLQAYNAGWRQGREIYDENMQPSPIAKLTDSQYEALIRAATAIKEGKGQAQ